MHIQEKVEEKIRELIKEWHIVKLKKCTSEHFIFPIVITVEKDGTVKLAKDANPMKYQIPINQYQMPNLLQLLDCAAHFISSEKRRRMAHIVESQISYQSNSNERRSQKPLLF